MMTVSTPEQPPTSRESGNRRIGFYSPVRLVVAAAAIVCALGLAAWFFGNTKDSTSASTATTEQERKSTAKEDNEVVLSESQHAAAALQLVPAETRRLQETRRVPGRISYNENLYLPITSPVRGIATSVKVLPGEEVQQGALLAEISSAEIGEARSDLLFKQEQLELATQRYERQKEIFANLEALLAQLQTRPEISAVETAFEGKLLGEHRSDILSAYAKLLLAESAASRTDPLAEEGVVSGRIVQERRSERAIAEAAFLSVCEATRATTLEQQRRVLAEVNDARRRLRVSQDQLTALCGSLSASPEIDESALSVLLVKAPMNGQITRKNIVPATRIEIADVLFILADTSSFWVSAQLREQDWESLRTAPGEKVQLQIPAIDNQVFAAQVRFVGSEVSPESRALPLVAEFSNSDPRLRPGLFSWVEVPTGPPRECLTVPSTAVMRDEGKPFVFVQQGPRTYARRDVKLGLEASGWVEILEGIKPGEQAVSGGAFTLKSELLLEGEP